ncbi:putative NTE family protein [Polaribacter huanghezhanensis]|uniref:patatin-like phospholipase family protein n=1 Tax=Polaribacter huanghezhanensis TaxID=1354726 RepID=UPI002647148E|nr:patatin-like phospholipase family protein [Polaribacter huanghezhanensis]WKD85048.1 putative NTE family protein [Polaribacter huanghezhanensis]
MNNIGVVLSGGGARGAAHIGVLQALNENGIYPSCFSGASAGALIAALYCAGYTPLEILKLSKEKEFLKIFRIGFLKKELTNMMRLQNFLKHHIHQKNIEDLKIPLHVSISNINSGRGEILDKGELIPLILASCAVPILFKPIKIKESLYVDGGLLNDLPIEPLKEKKLKIIGVNVCPNDFRKEIIGIMAIAERVSQMSIWGNIAPRIAQCDVAIELEQSYKYSMFDLKKSQELFDIGYEATLLKIKDIKSAIQSKK